MCTCWLENKYHGIFYFLGRLLLKASSIAATNKARIFNSLANKLVAVPNGNVNQKNFRATKGGFKLLPKQDQKGSVNFPGSPRGSGSSGNRGPGLRNKMQVKAAPKTKDAVNFGKLPSSSQGPILVRSQSFQSIPSQTQSTWTWTWCYFLCATNDHHQQCRAVHKKMPWRISRTVLKKVCDAMEDLETDTDKWNPCILL